MQVIALLFACLACAGQGRRVQRLDAEIDDSSTEKHTRIQDGSKAFSTLLLALDPEAGWQANTPSVGLNAALDRPTRRSGGASMKRWDKRRTLAEQIGGADDSGFDNVGLLGTVPVVFSCGEDVLKTKAIVGQPLSEVAAQAGQWIKYKCKKGQCGTCDTRIGGQWVHTCQHKIPHVPEGEIYEVYVRETMKKAKKSSRFYSFRSIIAGAKNNILGMVGFARDARRSKDNFDARLNKEDDIMALAEARRKRKAEAKAKEEAAKAEEEAPKAEEEQKVDLS